MLAANRLCLPRRAVDRWSSRNNDQNATNWLGQQADNRDLRVDYFGASTGEAAALHAAAHKPENVSAVVCSGGRPDLALDCLEYIRAPKLLIVGGNDKVVLELNKQALRWLRCEKRMAIVPRETHLFEEPRALDDAARMAQEWFLAHMSNQTIANQIDSLRRQSNRLH